MSDVRRWALYQAQGELHVNTQGLGMSLQSQTGLEEAVGLSRFLSNLNSGLISASLI